MKARIPVKLKRETMAEINRLADREYQKVKDKEIADATRRIFKTIVFALYKDFGFGRDRCAKALKSMTEIIEHSDTDEVFWEHIDRVVIDKLKLEFEKRDYTDNGKVVNFEGDEENDWIVRKLQTTSAKRKEWVDRRAECANLDVQIALWA